ncbi:MAG: hypothetical protein LBV33_01395, partial [Lachnospiraceae bacterium]|nr:hypothetical protein [Lachnospiraceae bacterium]
MKKRPSGKARKLALTLTMLLAVSSFPMNGLTTQAMNITDPVAVEVWFSSEKNPGDEAWFHSDLDPEYQLAEQPALYAEDYNNTIIEESAVIQVDPSRTYQSIVGFGTSLEETSIYNFARMSDPKKEEALRSLFDP